VATKGEARKHPKIFHKDRKKLEDKCGGWAKGFFDCIRLTLRLFLDSVNIFHHLGDLYP
jgi:hypothetical protein